MLSFFGQCRRCNGLSQPRCSGEGRFSRANQAYRFNGKDQQLTAANTAQLNSDFATVSFWVNVAALPAQGESFLLSFGGWQERWKISLPSHGKVVWTTNHENGISDMDAGSGNELPTGVWKHVALVHTGTQDKIFIDGKVVSTKNVAGKLKRTVHPLGIGFDPIDKGSYFNGRLDDIQIYGVALSDADVAALYAAQAAKPVVT
ncbi:MAG: LamG domain-containing protein, partial [Saprospiraceae bacterium]